MTETLEPVSDEVDQQELAEQLLARRLELAARRVFER
jgi:hypothetical protein